MIVQSVSALLPLPAFPQISFFNFATIPSISSLPYFTTFRPSPLTHSRFNLIPHPLFPRLPLLIPPLQHPPFIPFHALTLRTPLRSSPAQPLMPTHLTLHYLSMYDGHVSHWYTYPPLPVNPFLLPLPHYPTPSSASAVKVVQAFARRPMRTTKSAGLDIDKRDGPGRDRRIHRGVSSPVISFAVC